MADESIQYEFVKANKSDVIWLVNTIPATKGGSLLFSFDRQRVYSFWRDYPNALTKGERAIFDAQFPEWKQYYEGGDI